MLKKTLLTTLSISLSVLILLSAVFSMDTAYGQTEIQVECGKIIDGEFGQNAEEHIYLLTMQPRESFEVTVEPAGDSLQTVMGFYGPTGLRMMLSGRNNGGPYILVSQRPKLASGTLAARGVYKIRIANTGIGIFSPQKNIASDTLGDANYFGGVGAYTLSIGCTKSNGFKIEPGDVPQSTSTVTPLTTPTVQASATFTGVGFPGLTPVNFSEVAPIPLDLDTPTNGVIPLDNQILGFILDAKANDVLDLSYKRKSGNLNLGLVVLSATNKVVFQASLVTAESLTTRFTLPEAGQYTIGVFRINLVNPGKPQPTAFQLLAKLNAK